MRGDENEAADAGGTQSSPPAFQIIVLGAGGGPTEDNVTGLLVRSTATQWAKDSLLAVDGGIHLAAIIKILEEHLSNAIPRKSSGTPVPVWTRRAATPIGNGTSSPDVSPHSSHPVGHLASVPELNGHRPDPSQSYVEVMKPKLVLSTGPFANLELPHESAKANAAYLLRNFISTYLITHPHLDHISGFAVNTASFQHTSRPKRLAALPSTIDAIKDHIFNDVIWPNLSDEDGGVGLVSYMRLVEGGSVALGDGEGRGYIEVCDGLAVKSWSVSHGHCMKRHSHRGSNGGSAQDPFCPQTSPGRVPRTSVESSKGQNYGHPTDRICVHDSSAFFLRDDHTGNELLIFGDVEPDSLSLSPRTARVWDDAATKISAGTLAGILIECSYDDSQPDEILFGHLNPRHLMIELQVLAEKVKSLRHSEDAVSPRKRKRMGNNGPKMPDEIDAQIRWGRNPYTTRRKRKESRDSLSRRAPEDLSSNSHPRRKKRGSSVSPSTRISVDSTTVAIPLNLPLGSEEVKHDGIENDPENGRVSQSPVPAPRRMTQLPLEGLQIIIIHVKDTLKDGPPAGETILAQLLEYEEEVQLGCSYAISKAGTSIWL